jgi:DNA-binding transcriptional LysR family regulator
MLRTEVSELVAFVAVARERSFTRAAAQLGVSQSALSHTLRKLETNLGIRLLARTTRSVSPTEAGQRLIESIAPRLEEIDAAIASVSAERERPAGTVRITAGEHAAMTMVWPRLIPLLKEHRDIKVEISMDGSLIDIVEHRFDAGVRLGEQVAKDMIAVRIGPDWRFAIVGAPDYFSSYRVPKAPQDLTAHNCINLRLPTYGGLYAWEFEKGGQKLNVRVEGQLVFNSTRQMLAAAIEGLGLACVPEDAAEADIAAGRLVRVLRDWCPVWTGYHLYYPSRRQASPAFAMVVEALRWRGGRARKT